MKRILTLSLALAAVLGMAACKNNKKASETEKEETAMETTFDISTLPQEPVFDIVTNMGTIRVKLYSDTPKHRDNFAKLASEKFYDGILFHRIIKGFMIQSGDPLTKDASNKARFGTGGPGYEIPAEIRPEHKHIKGAIAAARKGDTANPMRNSSGSQFYIVEDEHTCAQLDGAYTVFGETIDGFDVIDRIASVNTDRRDCPIEDVKIESILLVPAQAEQQTVPAQTEESAE